MWRQMLTPRRQRFDNPGTIDRARGPDQIERATRWVCHIGNMCLDLGKSAFDTRNHGLLKVDRDDLFMREQGREYPKIGPGAAPGIQDPCATFDTGDPQGPSQALGAPWTQPIQA